MSNTHTYELAIIGGGLAGLTLAIQMRRLGHSVVLFEKEHYPFHRVCGEYISGEAWGFLKEMGIDPVQLQLPVINQLVVTAPDGTVLREKLEPGGIGISRHMLDQQLAGIAKREGVTLMEGNKVHDVIFREGFFEIRANSGSYTSTAAAGTYGKRSNLDLRFKRSFTENKPSKLNNYIGVKYHVRTGFPRDTIALHNFPDGYCGISAIEGDKYCLCYLTTAANLEKNGNNIEQMQQQVLSTNPHLAEIFASAEFLFDQPVAISQISFDKKTLFEDHLMMLGDAAGMITPLCGNGMSMALQASKMASEILHPFLGNVISRHEMERRYEQAWNGTFAARLRTGRAIQSMFGKPLVTNLFIRAMKPLPFLVRQLIAQTHGQPF